MKTAIELRLSAMCRAHIPFATCLAAIVSLLYLPPLSGATLQFTNTADSGAGSLRQAIADAALPANPGADVIMPSGLATAKIALASPIVIDDPSGVTVDATALAAGVTLDGGSASHGLLEVRTGSTAVLRCVNLANGGGEFFSTGGAITNTGNLTLERCTLTGNTVALPIIIPAITQGGAIWNNGTLTLARCTFSGNSAPNTLGTGGAIHNEGALTATNCTFYDNYGGEYGGALANQGTATLTHCTITANSAGGGGGGGVAGGTSPTIVRNCIIAGNSSDVDMPYGGGSNTFTSQGHNLIGTGNAAWIFYQTGDAIGQTKASIRLGPPADFGGAVDTLVPLPGSPAIDAAAAIAGLITDQRGFPRSADGNGVGGAAPDVGAVEVRRVVVNTRADENDTPAGTTVSLREALRDDGATDNTDLIVFDPAAFLAEDHSILVTSRIVVSGTSIVDATPLPAGAGITTLLQNSGLLSVAGGARLVVRGMSFTNGGGLLVTRGGAIFNDGALWLDLCTLSGNRAASRFLNSIAEGGAIINNGTATLDRCTLDNNIAAGTEGAGGAVSNHGSLTLRRCTLSGNTADYQGGAVFSSTTGTTGLLASSTSLSYCTLAGNTATSVGGAIHNGKGRTSLDHCTISGNTAPATAGGGVASTGDSLTITVVGNCIIAGNSYQDVDIPFDSNVNSFVSNGYNLIGWGSATAGFLSYRDTTGHTAASIRLAPLGDYGGPTRTMALRPGSPARDQTTGSTEGDQREFSPADQNADIGAYEAATPMTFSGQAYLWETLPATASAAQLANGYDYDGDGQSNGDECIALTNPGDPASVLRVSSMVRSGANLVISFPTVTGRTYHLQRSDNLGIWSDTGSTVNGNGAVRSFTVSAAVSRRFFRVAVTP